MRRLSGDHISICVCTFKRERLLRRLLEGLRAQETGERFRHSIVVVDNDPEASARTVVMSLRREGGVDLEYVHEDRRNIALARNAAVARAAGNMVAFIDDDEVPPPTWLLHLYRTLLAYRADGVLGPVRPQFEADPPRWVVKSGLLERMSFATGTVLRHASHTRTGNVLLRKEILDTSTGPFDPSYGRTGGEDTDYFRRMLASGRVFVWCEEAEVFESVPAERLKRRYLLKRALLRGEIGSRHTSIVSRGTLKSLLAVPLYTALSPFLLLTSHGLFMRYLSKSCDHLGKLLALCGIRFVGDRTFAEGPTGYGKVTRLGELDPSREVVDLSKPE